MQLTGPESLPKRHISHNQRTWGRRALNLPERIYIAYWALILQIRTSREEF